MGHGKSKLVKETIKVSFRLQLVLMFLIFEPLNTSEVVVTGDIHKD